MDKPSKRQEFFLVGKNCADIAREEAKRINKDRYQHYLGHACQNLLIASEQATSLPLTDRHKREEFFMLYQTLPGWIESQRDMQRASDHNIHLTHEERDRIVEKCSKFNDTLREVFNRWGQYITPRDVLHQLNNMIPFASREYYREAMEGVITGIRTEMLAELALTNMGIQTERATPEQDAKGIDYNVYIDDDWISIDIKTSQRNADNANTRNAFHGDNVVAICPFSRHTLNKIPTILPKDPYGQMLEPAREMLGEMFRLGIVSREECLKIRNELVQQESIYV